MEDWLYSTLPGSRTMRRLYVGEFGEVMQRYQRRLNYERGARYLVAIEPNHRVDNRLLPIGGTATVRVCGGTRTVAARQLVPGVARGGAAVVLQAPVGIDGARDPGSPGVILATADSQRPPQASSSPVVRRGVLLARIKDPN